MPGDWVDLDVTFNLTIDAVPRDGMLYELPDAVIVYTDFLAIPIGVNVSLISGSWNFFTQPSLPVLSRSQGRLAFHNVSAALALTPSFPGRSVTSRIFMTNNFTQRLQILGFEAPPSSVQPCFVFVVVHCFICATLRMLWQCADRVG